MIAVPCSSCPNTSSILVHKGKSNEADGTPKCNCHRNLYYTLKTKKPFNVDLLIYNNIQYIYFPIMVMNALRIKV